MNLAQTTDGARRLSGQSIEALYGLLRDKDTPKNAFTSSLGNLLWFADERAESVLRLVRSGSLWDADIIFRCFNEAYVKFLFVCFLNESERESSIDEFSNDLWVVHDLRTAERSEEPLSVKDIPPGLARALKGTDPARSRNCEVEDTLSEQETRRPLEKMVIPEYGARSFSLLRTNLRLKRLC